jgi:hypothetical protein
VRELLYTSDIDPNKRGARATFYIDNMLQNLAELICGEVLWIDFGNLPRDTNNLECGNYEDNGIKYREYRALIL